MSNIDRTQSPDSTSLLREFTNYYETDATPN